MYFTAIRNENLHQDHLKLNQHTNMVNLLTCRLEVLLSVYLCVCVCLFFCLFFFPFGVFYCTIYFGVFSKIIKELFFFMVILSMKLVSDSEGVKLCAAVWVRY